MLKRKHYHTTEHENEVKKHISQNNWRIQQSSAAVVAKAQYSASTDDRETVDYLLDS